MQNALVMRAYALLLENPLTIVLASLPLLLLLLLRRRRGSRGPAARDVPLSSLLASADAVGLLPVSQLPAAMASVREHVRDERILDAGALLARVRRTQRETGANVDMTILPHLSADELERRHAACVQALQELTTTEGWRELSVGDDGSRCLVQQNANRLLTKVELEMPIGAQTAVCVLRESQLYHTWFPRCVESTTLHVGGRMERLFRLVQQLKVPLLGALTYDLVLEGFGVDALGEGFLLACARSAKQKDWPHVAFPALPPRAARLRIETLHLLVEPLATGRTRATLQIEIDTSHSPIPWFVLEYVISKVTAKIFSCLADAAKRADAGDPSNAHTAAIRADTSFYHSWLRPRIERFLTARWRSAMAANASAMLPPTFTRSNVSEPERNEAMLLWKEEPELCAALAEVYDGLLLLGVVREILSTPWKKGAMVQTLREIVAWRRATGAFEIGASPLPTRLAATQVKSYIYGLTEGGCPVAVLTVKSVEDAMLTCARMNVTPDEFAQTRIWACEHSVRAIHATHQQDKGNGQSVLVIDFESSEFGPLQIHRFLPYTKAAVIGAAIKYAGMARCVYIVRPGPLFALMWSLVIPFLPSETRQKIRVVQRNAPILSPADEPPLTKLTKDSLPAFLGGAVPDDKPLMSLHYDPPDQA
ncbi:hypothetical protein AB1Y20_015182 [Prymnesium parvum]|uniref:CRAL-TRIO domain-containing protein n=1 Tax=Prymnesium parvum TaxID=97485 RepID=A0AB34K009_PRYPA